MKKLLLIVTLLSVGNAFSNIEKVKSCAAQAGISITEEQAQNFKGCIMSALAAKFPGLSQWMEKMKSNLGSYLPSEVTQELPTTY